LEIKSKAMVLAECLQDNNRERNEQIRENNAANCEAQMNCAGWIVLILPQCCEFNSYYWEYAGHKV
jgi:hypothetical protein